MNFYYNFLRLCNQVGKSPSRVVLEIGGTKSAITRWKNGGEPTDATVQKIAKYFGVLPDELKKGEEEIKKPPAERLTDGAWEMYQKLTPANQKVVESLIDSLLKTQSGE